jgi:hypothetical protein
VSELLSVLDVHAATDVHGLAEPALLVETTLLIEARARLDAVIAAHLQAMDVRDVTVSECGRQTRSWLVEEQHVAPSEAGRWMWVARRLPAEPDVAAAFTAGDINHDHVRLIIGCLARLDPEWRDAARAELLEFAGEHDPGMLAQLCAQLRVRTGADEDADAAAQRKYADRWVRLAGTFDGMTSLSGMLDPAAAATVTAAINALQTPTGPEDERTCGQRTADALTEMASLTLGYADLPDHGGERPTVVVTIPFAELRDGLRPGQLAAAEVSGFTISPSTARMIACDAGVIPAVLGANSEILDLGRKQRTWSVAQRRAARLRDRGCTWPQCQAPLDRCDLHHEQFWVRDHGHTNLNNSLHLCHFHHWLVHHTKWRITRNTSGHIEVSRT